DDTLHSSDRSYDLDKEFWLFVKLRWYELGRFFVLRAAEQSRCSRMPELIRRFLLSGVCGRRKQPLPGKIPPQDHALVFADGHLRNVDMTPGPRSPPISGLKGHSFP
ncbi:MAG: hypothetical protein ACK50J_00370, partial [Planctomyces sp.]